MAIRKAAFRPTFKIDGLRELQAGLAELKKPTQTNVLKRALMKAGAPVERDAETRAPELRGHLRRGIGIGTKLTRRQKALHRKESKVEVHIGAGGHPQAHLQEFGTAHHAPQPFMRPAWDNNKMRVLHSIRNDLATEIEKARQRAARKAARLAAKR